MKIPGKPKMGYTHFVAVIVPDGIADVIENCRHWMAEKYGCASGYRTVPHITLVQPFALDTERPVSCLEEALGEWARGKRGFECEINGFGAFAERTMFAHVEASSEWELWHGDLVRAFNDIRPGMVPVDRSPFTPHLTIANRDIPLGAVAPSLLHFAELDFHEKFFVDHAALFEWEAGAWKVRGRFECAG